MSDHITLSWRSLAIAIACGAGIAAVATVGAQPADKWWTGYGNGPDNSRYLASAHVRRGDVTQLQPAGTFPFGDARSIPILVRGVIYGGGNNASLVAPDTAPG